MASYWKSNTRYFCDICKCWLADNRASIEFHERGKSHKEKKEKHLSQLRKRSAEQYKNQQQAGFYLRQMEDAALQAYKKDLARQGLVIDSEMPNLASSRPNAGIHELHFQDGKKKKIKIHNIEDMRESKIAKNSSWVKQISPEGTEYYWNSETGISQWEKPNDFKGKVPGGSNTTEQPGKSQREKPEEKKPGSSTKVGNSKINKQSRNSPWQKQVTPDGKIYYWNSKTETTQWEKPRDFPGEDKNDSENTEKTVSKNETKCQWTKEVSPEGHTYYWNSDTGISQWQEPDDYVEPKLCFVPVKTEEETEDASEVRVKKPKHNPYGSWNTVREIRPQKQIDWQLPIQRENSATEGLVDWTSLEEEQKPEPPKFNQKVVTSLGNEGGSSTFKKKTSKQRSIRKRNHDD